MVQDALQGAPPVAQEGQVLLDRMEGIELHAMQSGMQEPGDGPWPGWVDGLI